MLPLSGLFFLVTSTVEALVLHPVSHLSSSIAQDSAGGVAPSLETVSSALLEGSSFTPTTPALSIANYSLASNNSLSAHAEVRCSPNFGTGLDPQSCKSAVRSMEAMNTRPYSWGPRDTGIVYDFPLPRRWVSLDGTCIIGATLFQDNSAIASMQEVALGAVGVITRCIENRSPSEGGYAKNFGGDNKLGVFVVENLEPIANVRCYGSAAITAIVNSCQSIMDRMDVNDTVGTFGRGGGVDVELPYIWHSDDHRCIMTLRASAPVDKTSWLKVWEAATVATGMCSMQGKKGLYTQIGTNGKLYLEVAAEGVGDYDRA